MPTPSEIIEMYHDGLEGCIIDEEDIAAFRKEEQHVLFGETPAFAAQYAKDIPRAYLYKSAQKFDPKFGAIEAQTAPDCVSHGQRNALDVTRAVEIDIKGEPEMWVVRGATENIYQARQHRGAGMSPSVAARYVSKTGGLLLRKNYGSVDLSRYNASLGVNKRIPREIFIDEAHKHPVRNVASIESLDELKEALANGYGCTIASGWGFESRRDKYGKSRPRGGWNHLMHLSGYDDDIEGVLVVNSWGAWNSGPKYANQPDGSFWVDYSIMERWIRDATIYAFSQFEGFPARQIPNYGLGEWL